MMRIREQVWSGSRYPSTLRSHARRRPGEPGAGACDRPRTCRARYFEMLDDMEERRIARLNPRRAAAFDRVSRRHRELPESFGYTIREEAGMDEEESPG